MQLLYHKKWSNFNLYYFSQAIAQLRFFNLDLEQEFSFKQKNEQETRTTINRIPLVFTS